MNLPIAHILHKMKNKLPGLILLICLAACQPKEQEVKATENIATKTAEADTVDTTPAPAIATIENQDSSAFIPKGFVVYDKISGDINNDKADDIVYVIKATDSSKIIQHESLGRLDRNRRGLIILFNRNGLYELAAKNRNCFSSENEDGGVYYAPELDVSVKKGTLFINYRHGRYGYWTYTLKYMNNDFVLIGYDATSSRGPVPQKITSINFLTGKKLVKDNINKDDDDDSNVVYTDRWETLKNAPLLKLTEIRDFDEMSF